MCIWTFLGSIVTTLLIHLNAASSEYTAKITALNQYMAHRKLPQGLRQRIRDSYEARWKAEKHFDEEEIMQELPNSLRTEVCLYTCGDLIASVPFFEDAEEGFTTSVVTLLRPAVYLKDDMVIREGEVSREMYFIKSGAIQVEVDEQVVTVLKKGSYFGEIGLLRACRRTASIRAVSETVDLFVLSKEDFDNVMKEYPESSKAMDLIAEHRLRALHASAAWQSKRDALTDYRSANLGAKIEHVLKMGEDGEEGSTDDGYHSLTLHSVASSAAHHTGNPFAAGNTPRISAGESSTLLAMPSGLAPLPASSSTMAPRTSGPQGPASRGASGLPDIALRPVSRGQKSASSSSQGSPYALQRSWAPEPNSQPPGSSAPPSRPGQFKDLLSSLSLTSSPPKPQPRLSMLRRTASAGDLEHLHFLPDAAANSTVVSEWGAGMGRPDRRLRPESSKPFGILEVPEEGEGAEVKAPLLMTQGRQH
ncbi:hypothetical protein CVIRNUC_001307 [Coccomyxa viridis]|uniref:Cyclic nucleotide-binding domain-containing protein n=1 Tax=Coccomyxa viridis TaxID=1274662 RepID=A0AAV1HX44_9CHLO|nr:hypothetical protein CVIRNUC_001307 [Coccomyxa viridis]